MFAATSSVRRLLASAGTAGLALVGAVVVVAVWGSVARTLRDAQPAAPATRAHAIVWGDRVFVSAADLAGWLRSRGQTYAAWADAHPQMSALLEHRSPPVTVEPAPAERAPRPVAAPRERRAAKTTPSHGGSRGSLIVLLALALGAGCAAGALVPSVAGHRLPRLAGVLRPARQLLVVGSAGVFVGLLAALMQA